MLRTSAACSILFTAFLLLAIPVDSHAVVVDPGLRALAAEKNAGELIPVLMIFDDLPVLTEEELLLGDEEVADPNKRRKQYLAALKKKIKVQQQSSMFVLRGLGQGAHVQNVQELYLADALSFDANSGAIAALEELNVAATMYFDQTYDLISGTRREPAPDTAAEKSAAAAAATDTVWSVKYINADRVWNELGYTGNGVVVGHIDSGVWMTHPDLSGQLWVNPGEIPGNGVDDDDNGFIDDVNGWDFGVGDNNPNDDSPSPGHGTHTAGTVVGDGTGGTQTGVAPGARLMALKVWKADGTGGSLGTIWAAEQYAAENGARIITMSLGIPGIIPDTYLRNDRYNFNNLRNAGVLMFNSAGNDHSAYDPPIECSLTARVPSPWSATGEDFSHTSGVVTVGGTGYLNDTVYYASSRGPVTWQTVVPWVDYPYNPGPGLIKPDVSAPGVAVNSTVIPSGYSGNTWSGTSMACPHAAGVAALMLEKNPSLSPAGIDSLMQQNAVDLGTVGKDNDFGSGRIDAYAIVQGTPTLSLPDIVYTEIYPDFAGDDVLDPGMVSQVAFQLRNVSTVENATIVTGDLSVVANPWVTITDGLASFPDIASGGSEVDNLADPFELSVSASAPQGFEFTLLLTILDDAGFQRTFDIPWYVGLPEFRTHNVGSAYLTITDQGIIGYMDQGGVDGDGLGYLGGASVIYVGSFWAGVDAAYVCARDFSGETYEWEPTTDPNGRVRDRGALNSDQTYSAIFSDSGHASPKPLVVHQNSFAFSGEPNDDFVILEYILTNEGAEDLTDVYTGVFCDLDIADSGANEGGSDASRNLIYMYSAGGPYYGIAQIGGTAHNMTLVNNATYVYPLLHVSDANKMSFLNGTLSVPTSTAPADWSALTSTHVSLAPNGGKGTVVYAVVYGESLADLQANVDAANAAYNPFSPVTEDSPVKLVHLAQNHPNPFNPATNIKFAVPRDGHVDLAVFDLSGRRVKTLVSESRAAGDYTISWNGTDDAGSRVPSGMYFYRFVTGGESVSRKMTLLK